MTTIVDKVDAVTKIGKDRIAVGGAQPPPKSVKIEITARCNLRCQYCSLRTRKRQPKKDMSLDFFKAITRDMKDAGVEEIGMFYIGESFMAPELLADGIRWCKKELGFDWVFLTANATMANPGAVRAVMKAGLDSLKWSANFTSKEQFKKITGASGKMFDRAMSNIRFAKTIRDSSGYNTLVSASSILSEGISGNGTVQFLDEYIYPYVDKHYFLPMYQMGMKKSRTKDIGNATPGNMGRIDEKTKKPNRNPLPCWAVFTEGHVRVDGGLSACCFGSDARFDMGVLDGSNFMEQWNSKRFIALREAHIRTIAEGPMALAKTPCRVCVAYE
jgi:pyruvate-formate lyase-activating enzyme